MTGFVTQPAARAGGAHRERRVGAGAAERQLLDHAWRSSATDIFNPIRARVVDTVHGSAANARVVVIDGPSIADGALSPQSVGLALHRRRPRRRRAAGPAARRRRARPRRRSSRSARCWSTTSASSTAGFFGCCGRATVTVINPPPSFGGFAHRGRLDERLRRRRHHGQRHPRQRLPRRHRVGARAATSRSTPTRRSSTATTRSQPAPGDPENIDVNQLGDLDVSFTHFTASYGGTCDCFVAVVPARHPGPGRERDPRLPLRSRRRRSAGRPDRPTRSRRRSPASRSRVRSGRALGVQFDAPLFAIAEDDERHHLRLRLAVHGVGRQRSGPVPAAGRRAESHRLARLQRGLPELRDDDAGRATCRTASRSRSRPRASTSCSLAGRVRPARPPASPASTSGTARCRSPPACSPLIIAGVRRLPAVDAVPHRHPADAGARRDRRRRTRRRARRSSRCRSSWSRSSRTTPASRSCCAAPSMPTIGLDLAFAAGGARLRSLRRRRADDITVAVLVNPLGVNETALETDVLPPLVGALLPSLAGSLASFPLPEFLGLGLSGVEIARSGQDDGDLLLLRLVRIALDFRLARTRAHCRQHFLSHRKNLQP